MSDIQIRDKIERRPIGVLVPYARNARTHSDEQVNQIAASIREFGWTMPVLVDGENGIIAGHGRLLAAFKLGMSEVPVIDASDLTEEQKRAYILADNQLSLNAGWDKKLLGVELADLTMLGVDMTLTGFNETELGNLMAVADTAQAESSEAEDDIPAMPRAVTTRPGDLWNLGEHRLICADAGDRAAIERLMQGQTAKFCFTSPPYADQRDYVGGIKDWDGLMRSVFGAAPLGGEAQLLVNLGLVHREKEVYPYWNEWLDWMRVIAWRRFAWYVWDQGPGMPGDWNGRLAPAFEFVFHFNRKSRYPNKLIPCKHAGEKSHANPKKGSMRRKDGSGGGWTHGNAPTQEHRIPDSVIRISRHKGKIGKGIDHPAVFPVALPEHLMLTYSNPGDICYEPFCGSGTSIIAAEKTRRRMRAVEFAPEYVDVALERFRQVYPDVAITHAETGQTLDEVREQRASENQQDEALS